MEQRPQNAIGRNLQRLRAKKEWTQAELAARAQRGGWDIDRGTLAKIEAGVRRVYDTEVWHLARLLECSAEDLFPPVKQMREKFIPPTKPRR